MRVKDFMALAREEFSRNRGYWRSQHEASCGKDNAFGVPCNCARADVWVEEESSIVLDRIERKLSEPAGNYIHHVVGVKFYDSVSSDDRESIKSQQMALGERCGGVEAGILQWNVGWNQDRRKGWHLVEISVFRDESAFQAFRKHPEHVAFAGRLQECADWVVLDLLVPMF